MQITQFRHLTPGAALATCSGLVGGGSLPGAVPCPEMVRRPAMLRTLFAAAAAAALLVGASPGQAAIHHLHADLSGAAEVTPTGSPGTGEADVLVNDVSGLMVVDVDFTGLEAGVTASHIHCCTAVAGTGAAGVATTVPTFTGFPSGVTFGSYHHVFDMTLASSYNPSFVTAHGGTAAGAEAFLFAGMFADKSYLNIH